MVLILSPSLLRLSIRNCFDNLLVRLEKFITSILKVPPNLSHKIFFKIKNCSVLELIRLFYGYLYLTRYHLICSSFSLHHLDQLIILSSCFLLSFYITLYSSHFNLRIIIFRIDFYLRSNSFLLAH